VNKNIKQTSFQFKILFVIISVAFVCITLVAGVSYFKSREALQHQSVNQFSSMGEMMKNRLSAFQSQTRTFATRLGKDRLIEGLFLAYEGAFFGASLFPGEDINIYTTHYQNLESIYGKRTEKMAKDFSLSDVFLVSLDSQVLMTARPDKNNFFLGRNLLNGVYKKSLLTKCFNSALTDTKGELFFSGYEYNEVSKKPEAYYCVKQFAEFDHLSEGIKKGEDMGIVITRINIDQLNSMVTQREGMGETGQAYIVGGDHLLRTDFFVNKEEFNTINSLKTKKKLITKSIDFALEKKSGTHFIIDPNGEEVLSYYSPITMFGHTWALVAEIQTTEMFAPVRSMMIFVSMLAGVALLIIVFAGMFITKKLVQPITDANNILGSVANEVTDNADKMKSNSEGLSDGATQIAAAIQETVTTLDELSSMVNKNLENVELSSQKSEESKEVAERGKIAVTSMIGAMGEINTSNGEIVDEMNNISNKMNEIIDVINEIGTKTNIINDIVFQTKLLSFNASVEAARAGEHGKGFAVVAEEVGSLATASGKAATEISEMLDESVKKVESIVSDTKVKIDTLSTVGQEKVSVGTKTAHECEEVLDQILVNVVEVNEKVSEITNASNEQATGIKEVSKAMSQLDEMTHNTSTISAEALNSSEVLNSEATKLSEVVENLNILVRGGVAQNMNDLHEIKVDVSSKVDRDLESKKKKKQKKKATPTKIKLVDTTESSSGKNVATKKASGSGIVVPNRDDDRFEDI